MTRCEILMRAFQSLLAAAMAMFAIAAAVAVLGATPGGPLAIALWAIAAALLALALLFLIFVILCQAEADAEARDGERADPPPATVRGGAGTVNEGGRGPVSPAATAG